MGRVIRIIGGEGGFFTQEYKIKATTVSGAVALRSATAADAGEVQDATTTDFTDALGLYAEAITYTAAPTNPFSSGPIPAPASMEGVVRIITHPMALMEFRVAGGATVGLALATTAPSNILTNTVADATGLLISSVETGTVSMVGGLIRGRTGANKGQTRVMTAHVNSVSDAVVVAFTKTIAVGDTFTRVPWSKKGVAMQLTTDLTEANGIIATGTGGSVVVYRVRIGIDDIAPGRDNALVEVLMGKHQMNRYV